MEFHTLVENIGKSIDFAGVVAIAGSAFGFTVWLLFKLAIGADRGQAYRAYRRVFGRGILVGLELLVAGDIIRTVAIEPTLQSIGVLAGIVLVRTLLSFILELETTGKWPWQKG